MSKVQIKLPPKLIPVFTGKRRVRGAHGGRGSAKTRTFAKMSGVRAYMAAESGISGIILCGREWMNSLKDSSMAEVKLALRDEPWLETYFDIGQDYIRTKNKRVEYVFTGLSRNLDSLKSKSNILIAWIDEAEGVSEAAWQKLEPTLRHGDSELWVTWNPELEGSPTDISFRQNAHLLEGNSMIVEMNYNDNPWFPQPLDALRRRQQQTLDPNKYAWIWDGDYLHNSEAQVFANKYRIADFEPQSNWNGPYFGLDFGFAQDPTAGVKSWVFDNTLYIEYESYAHALELDHTADRLAKDLPDIQNHVCRADNARPESISYLKRHGLRRMMACAKGKGSVEDGIEHIKSYNEVVIHSRCVNTAKEFRLYSYKVDRLSGDVIPVLVDANNHIIDAQRYALEPIMKNKGRGIF